jgi:hypothetical protein
MLEVAVFENVGKNFYRTLTTGLESVQSHDLPEVSIENLVGLKPRPEPAALAFSYSEPGQSRCWAITQEVSDPPIVAVRFIHNKAQLGISGTRHVSGMDRCHQI